MFMRVPEMRQITRINVTNVLKHLGGKLKLTTNINVVHYVRRKPITNVTNVTNNANIKISRKPST